MTRYFDASALVKRYLREEGSARVARLLQDCTVATSRLSIVEVASALFRRHREGDLRDPEAAVQTLHADAGKCLLVELQNDVMLSARDLLSRQPLRAADAIQLASCMFLRETVDPDTGFVCCDERLKAAAAAEGLRIL